MARRGRKGRRKGRRGRSGKRRVSWKTVMAKIRKGQRLTRREREFLSRALDRRKKAKDER